MTKKKWAETVKKQMEKLGIVEPAYDTVVETLAAILEKRDKVELEYKRTGSQPVLMYTNKGGASNLSKNPLLVLWDDLNKSALAYWRELGLTPSSYKKMTGDGPKQEKPNGLVEALKSVEA